MVRRKPQRGLTTSPRFRLKMYDWFSKGGRIPATLVMEVVDAMDSARNIGYGEYAKLYDKDFAQAVNEVGLPSILVGITRSLVFHVHRMRTEYGLDNNQTSELIERVLQEKGISHLDQIRDVLYKTFGIERKTTSGEQTGTKSKKV